MLGRFLEYSIVTPDIRESLDFYLRLGLHTAEVGEAWAHPYAVVTDGRIHLGLHQHPSFEPSVTFAKPGLLKHLQRFEELGVEFEFRHLAGDVFNEIAWFDPSGHLIRLVEARTFSPVERATPDAALCGYFVEIGLPTPNLQQAKDHWEQFGFVGLDELGAALPRVSCTSDTIDVGLYEPAYLREPTLVFEVTDLRQAADRLNAAGVAPLERKPAQQRQESSILLTAPEGTRLLVVGGRND